MLNRRGFLLGSAAIAAISLVRPAFTQTTTTPATKRGFLDRPGCRIYYEVTGSGPAIIFAHGIGSNHLTWWQQVPYFSGRYTCVTFASPGLPAGERDSRWPGSEGLCRRSRRPDRAPATVRRAPCRAVDGRLDLRRIHLVLSAQGTCARARFHVWDDTQAFRALG